MSNARSDVAPGGGAGIAQRYELFDGLFAWKDWSKNPPDNANRLDKIGNQQAARIALICSFEEENHKRFTQDGLTSPLGGKSLNLGLEPDNLWFRRHEDGGAEDQVHALRMIIDEKHGHASKENRTSALVDQADEQNQGYFHDLFKIKDVRATGDEPETFISKAGESIFACSDGTPSGGDVPRYHMILNFFTQAGYVTNGEDIAQLKHLFKIIPFDSAVATGSIKDFHFPCKPVAPFTQDETADGEIDNVDGEPFGELALWSDFMLYQDENNKGPLGIDPVADVCPEGIFLRGGFHWTIRRAGSQSDQIFPDPANKDNGKLESELEDSPEFGRKVRRQYLRPYVCVPRPGVPTIPRPNSVPPGGELPPGELGPSVATTGSSGKTKTREFKANKTTAIQYQLSLSDMEGRDLGFRAYWTVDSAPGPTDTVKLILGYATVKCDVGESTSPSFTFITKELIGRLPEPPFDSEIPDPGDVACCDFTIPNADLETGDMLILTFWRSRTDSFSGSVQNLENRLTLEDSP